MGETGFEVAPMDGGSNKKSCDCGTCSSWGGLTGSWLGRSFNFLKIASAVSLTTMSVESGEEAGESVLKLSESSLEGLGWDADCGSLGGGPAIAWWKASDGETYEK